MKPVWRALGWASGVVGAAVTGAAVSVVAHGSRVAAHRRDAAEDDPYADEPLGELSADRQSTVAADDGVPLAVREVWPADGGRAELTVVLVHGLAVDSRCWYFQRRELPQLADPKVRVVLYDQRSHGSSGRGSRRRSTIEQLAKDLDAVLRSTAPQGPVVIAAHSLGGMAVMGLAEQRAELFGERVRGVALLGTSAGDVGQSGLPRPVLSRSNPLVRGFGLLAALQPGLVERARRTGEHVTWSVVRALAFGSTGVSPALVDLMERMIATTPVAVMTNFLDTISTHDRRAALSALARCEVLVLGGDADRLTPFSHSEVITAELPRADLVRAPGAGHMVMLERAELVTDHLAELLGKAAKGRKRRWKRA